VIRRQRGRSDPSASSEDSRKGGCSAPPPFDPVSIPHNIEKRGVTSGGDREPNRQVDGPFRPPMQVTEPGSNSQGGDTGSNPVGTTARGLFEPGREKSGANTSENSARAILQSLT